MHYKSKCGVGEPAIIGFICFRCYGTQLNYQVQYLVHYTLLYCSGFTPLMEAPNTESQVVGSWRGLRALPSIFPGKIMHFYSNTNTNTW